MESRLLTCAAIAALALLGFLGACSPATPPDLPDIHFSEVPDLPQQGPEFNSSYDSELLCAPVAVSNSLMWLQGDFSRDNQIALVEKLAHYRYMTTSPNIGTGPRGVLLGVEKYLSEKGQALRRLEYAGMRKVPDRFRASDPLTLKWLHAGLTPRSAVWLNLGWYSRPIPGVYRRVGGHWVTLVGFAGGKLLVHDPGPWQVAPEPQVTIEKRAWLVDANEWHFMPRLLALQGAPGPGHDYTLLDGAVILELGP